MLRLMTVTLLPLACEPRPVSVASPPISLSALTPNASSRRTNSSVVGMLSPHSHSIICHRSSPTRSASSAVVSPASMRSPCSAFAKPSFMLSPPVIYHAYIVRPEQAKVNRTLVALGYGRELSPELHHSIHIAYQSRVIAYGNSEMHNHCNRLNGKCKYKKVRQPLCALL